MNKYKQKEEAYIASLPVRDTLTHSSHRGIQETGVTHVQMVGEI